jgi:hypothetical protein
MFPHFDQYPPWLVLLKVLIDQRVKVILKHKVNGLLLFVSEAGLSRRRNEKGALSITKGLYRRGIN